MPVHAHPLRQFSVPDMCNWFCDQCHTRGLNRFAPRHRCVTCADFDLCENCARDHTHPHQLKVVTFTNETWWCDSCRQVDAGGNLGGRFRCNTCVDFDLCTQCYQAQENEERAAAEQGQQIHEHPLRLVQDLNLWFCDSCGTDFRRQDPRFRCGSCRDFDLCETCHNNTPHNHPVKRVTFTNGRWHCNICQQTNAAERYRCYECVDWDACGGCFTSNNEDEEKTAPAPAQPPGQQCLECQAVPADVVNLPCGHMFFCRPCTDTYRAQNREICPHCEQASTTVTVNRSAECSFCYERFESDDLFCLGPCQHLLCISDAVRSIKTEAADAANFPLKCPCISNGQRCSQVLFHRELSRLVRKSMAMLPVDEALTKEDLLRLERFTLAAAVPPNLRLYCPDNNCGALIVMNDAVEGNNCVAPQNPRTQCPDCNQPFCWNCRVAWHAGFTCEEYRTHAEGNDETVATAALMRGTSKPCPRCGTHITHYQDHGCHHILPGTGCPACNVHFCYVCLGPWPCQNGDPTFCNDACACPPCPDCRPGESCAHCNGCRQCRV